ncbi:MAG: NfeD family protein [Planctomycetota bacterium]|jgi:membrane-bound serine protease (ClpP class)
MIVLAAASEAANGADAAAGGVWVAIALAVVLLVAAVGLAFLEALVPSFGLLTVLALVCAAGAIVAAFTVGRTVGFVFVAITIAIVPLTAYLAIRVLKGAGVVLETTSGPSDESEGPSGPEPGARGVAITALRPAGVAMIDGRRVSVVTDGPMVEPEQQIEVVRVEGKRTIVRGVRA